MRISIMVGHYFSAFYSTWTLHMGLDEGLGGGVGIETNCLLQIKEVSLNRGQGPVNLSAQQSPTPTPSFSPFAHLYLQMTHLHSAQYEATICFTPVLTFNSRDNGRGGRAVLWAISMYFNIQPS